MTLFVGMGPGYAVSITVTASSEFDSAAVSNPRVIVVDPRAGRDEWPATISAQDAASVTISAPFPTEQPHMSGTWRGYALFDAPGGVTKRSSPFSFVVEREI